jgi:uncharacterized protein (DUF1800 family)
MGQTLLEPPNVAGWKGERAWITSATWLMRANFAAQLFDERYKVRPAAAELLPQEDPTGRADAALELLLDGGVDRATRAAIRAVARRSPSRPNLLHAIMCLPEAQLL